jgi:thioredoxin
MITFQREIKKIIKFSAEWCGPCKRISPVFKKLSEEYKNIDFYDVDTDENVHLAERFNITAMPTFVFLKDEKEVLRLQGADENKLRKSVKEF